MAWRQVAPLLPSADWFAVNSLEEGLELRGPRRSRGPWWSSATCPWPTSGGGRGQDLSLTVYNTETIQASGRLDRLCPAGPRCT